MQKNNAHTTPQRKVIRIVFILLLPFLFFQFWYAKNVQEPYPAAILNVFGGVDGKEGVHMTVTQEIEVWKSGKITPLTADQLLSQMIHPLRFFAMQHTFGPKTTPETLHNPELKQWIGQRLEALHTPAEPDSMVVVWKKHNFDVRKNPVSETTEIMARIPVALGGGS